MEEDFSLVSLSDDDPKSAEPKIASWEQSNDHAANWPTMHAIRRKTAQLTIHSGVAPCVIAASANAYYLWNDHWEHWSHMPPLEERTEYAYQNIRIKNYQWGNGDQVRFNCVSTD